MRRRVEIRDLAMCALWELDEADRAPEGKRRAAQTERALQLAHEALTRIRHSARLTDGWDDQPL